jgi:hypothetical protein
LLYSSSTTLIGDLQSDGLDLCSFTRPPHAYFFPHTCFSSSCPSSSNDTSTVRAAPRRAWRSGRRACRISPSAARGSRRLWQARPNMDDMDNNSQSINYPYSEQKIACALLPPFLAQEPRLHHSLKHGPCPSIADSKQLLGSFWASAPLGPCSLSRAPAPGSERQQPGREGERLMANPSPKCLLSLPSE